MKLKLLSASPPCEFAAYTNVLTTNPAQQSSPRYWKLSAVRDFHVTFKFPFIYIHCAGNMELDKEKPYIGSMKGLNMVMVRHTTLQAGLSNYRAN
jgi:hypothetical protein